MRAVIVAVVMLVLGAPASTHAQSTALPHVSLFRTEGDAPLAVSLRPHRRARGLSESWSERCPLPCSIRVQGTWDVQLSTVDGRGRHAVARPIDGYGGGEYVARYENHSRARTLGYLALGLGAVAAAGAVVSFLVMVFEGLARLEHAVLAALGGGMAEPHDEPWWIIAPFAISAIVLLIVGGFAASDHDVAELTRVGPGPSGAFPRPARRAR